MLAMAVSAVQTVPALEYFFLRRPGSLCAQHFLATLLHDYGLICPAGAEKLYFSVCGTEKPLNNYQEPGPHLWGSG